MLFRSAAAWGGLCLPRQGARRQPVGREQIGIAWTEVCGTGGHGGDIARKSIKQERPLDPYGTGHKQGSQGV